MNDEVVFTVAFGIGIFIVGLMYKAGILSGRKNSKYRNIISFEAIIFKEVKESILIKVDNISFWICASMAILTIINGLLQNAVYWIPNITMIFVVIALLGTVIFRLIYTYRLLKY